MRFISVVTIEITKCRYTDDLHVYFHLADGSNNVASSKCKTLRGAKTLASTHANQIFKMTGCRPEIVINLDEANVYSDAVGITPEISEALPLTAATNCWR